MKTKTKINMTIIVLAALAVAGVLFMKPSGQVQGTVATAKSEQLYTCGMHPQVIQNKPGNCPICGMKLIPIRKQVSPVAGDASAIRIDPVTIQNMGIRTANVVRGPLRRTIRTVATVDYNEPGLADVTTKFKGWIEKLYVATTGQQVHRGDPLFEIYAPELYSAQVEYLLAIGSKGDALKISALTKLKYLDISDKQIAELEKTRQVLKTLSINAPRDGIVVEKNAVEGQMADAGMKLYRLADLSLVWVYAQVYEQDLAFLKLGQEAVMTLAYLPGRQFRGRVTYIYPNVDEKTRTARVRMEFHNPGFFLKPGMFATVTITSELEPSVLLVPDSAILRSGERNTVFVALPGGRFDPRAVMLGPQAENDQYQVLSGLTEGEKIVTSGQFMLDSESQLREAIQKMIEPGKVADSALETNRAVAPVMPVKPETTVYICPMPEHLSIMYDHPGACPICGMALVPISLTAMSKLPPGGKLLYYTCPMSEHSDVHMGKPGQCPKCGMTLIPVMASENPPTNESAKPAAPMPETLYTCPMPEHADVVYDHPGACPKCGMTLVETSKVPHGKNAEAVWRSQHPEIVPGPAAPDHQH